MLPNGQVPCVFSVMFWVETNGNKTGVQWNMPENKSYSSISGVFWS